MSESMEEMKFHIDQARVRGKKEEIAELDARLKSAKDDSEVLEIMREVGARLTELSRLKGEKQTKNTTGYMDDAEAKGLIKDIEKK